MPEEKPEESGIYKIKGGNADFSYKWKCRVLNFMEKLKFQRQAILALRDQRC